MSDSSSSRSSRSPSPEVVKKKSKKKDKQRAAVDGPRNEGNDPTWDYSPPKGAVLVEEQEDIGEFDWDSVKNNEDVELWLIRVPDSIKPKHLKDLQIGVPSSSTSGLVGSFKRKAANYDVWSIGKDDDPPAGGEEVKSLSCLLPRKSKKGKLYPAPKPFARHLVFVAQPVIPETPEVSATHQNHPRFSYPPEVLKHRFLPYGSLERTSGQTVRAADEDVPMAEATNEITVPPSPKKKSTAVPMAPTTVEEISELSKEVEVKKKGKKRKGEVGDISETPAKKSKKSKSS